MRRLLAAAAASCLLSAISACDPDTGNLTLVFQQHLPGENNVPRLFVASDGERAWVTAGVGATDIIIYDVSDPRRPVETGYLSPPPAGGARWLRYEDGLLHAVGGQYSVYDTSASPALSLTHQADSGGFVDFPILDGDVTWLLMSQARVQAFDRVARQVVSTTSLDDYSCVSMVLDGDARRLYVSCTDALHVIDVADAESPAQVGAVSPVGMDALALHDQHLYSGDERGLHVLDLADPLAPVPVRTLAPAGWGYGPGNYEIKDGRLFALTSSGMYCFDLADPASPSQLGHQPLGNDQVFAYGMTLANGLIYAVGWGNFWVIEYE